MTMTKRFGSISCQVIETPIQQLDVIQFVNHRGHGGQNFFFGAVRERNHGKHVVAVSYDAFIPLAEKILHEIASEAQQKWGSSLKICMIHRVGRLEVGDLSVAIGVSAPHRDESYQASRYIIEELKLRAPIWKKEFYDNGETEWLKGHALCQHSKTPYHHEHAKYL
jgi:molybdopterin synthase catalytic subunit